MDNSTLNKKLLRYTGAAGAVLAGGAVNGQILYTDYSPDTVVTGTDIALLDVNQDGNPDFGVVNITSGSTAGWARIGPYSYSGAIVGSTPSSFPYANKLNAGATIGPSSPFLPDGYLGTMAYYVSAGNPFSEPWNGGVVDGFVGMKIYVSGATHYGWMRCDVTANVGVVTIKDAAINLAADASINAGQSINVMENLKASVIMTNDGKTVRLTVNEEMGRYNLQVIDITGRTLINEDVEAGEYTVNTAGLPAGTYIINTRFGDEILSRRFTLR